MAGITCWLSWLNFTLFTSNVTFCQMGRDISRASITQCPSPGQEPITCDIRTWVNRRNNFDMLCLTSFSLSSMLASNLDKSTEKRFQNNIGRQKAGTRAMWPKLSVTDCSLLDSRSLYHVNAPSHRRGGALRDETRNGCGGADSLSIRRFWGKRGKMEKSPLG